MLTLKINSYWAQMIPGTSISMVFTSPLFNESGNFSYPFELPFNANRHIFETGATPEEDVRLKNFRAPFELYIDGLCMLKGVVAVTDDKVNTQKDRIGIELRSGTDSFDEAVEKIALHDLDLSENYLGYADLQEETFSQTYYTKYYHSKTENRYRKHPLIPTRSNIFMQQFNTGDVFPISNFINIPLTVNGQLDGKSEKAHPLILSPFRAMSSPCFFVLYILKKIVTQTGYRINSSSLEKMEDMKRLVCVNTKMKTVDKLLISNNRKVTVENALGDPQGTVETYYRFEHREQHAYYASAENLPEIEAKEFLKALKTAFGIRYTTSDENELNFFFIREVLRSTEVTKLNVKNIQYIMPINETFAGATVAYKENKGDEYSYNDYNNIRVYDTYENMMLEWNGLKDEKDSYGEPVLESDVTLKVIKDTGNFYRTGVDKDKYTDPQLFEVAQFLPYTIKGNENTETEKEELTINFSPVIPTIVQTSGDDKFHTLANFELPSEAIYVNVAVDWKKNTAKKIDAGESDSVYDKDFAETTFKELMDNDLGFMIGVVRTTPKDGTTGEGYDIINVDSDGFGNDEWATTVSTNTITADSVTDNGQLYDYNGAGQGTGTTMDQYISLKLWNGKQNFKPDNAKGVDAEGNPVTGKEAYNNNPTGVLPNRGLVPQFLQEYLRFLQDKKTIEIKGELNPSELLDIPWDKWTVIEQYKGLLNEISLDISDNGISNVTIQHYVI